MTFNLAPRLDSNTRRFQAPSSMNARHCQRFLPLDLHRMFGSERRQQTGPERAAALRRGLSAQQLATLATLEGFQWTLTFVRRPLFGDAMPIVFDRGSQRYVVIEADGSINDVSGLTIRA